ncbi:thymidylate kinase [Pantoea piersonii]|uniref:thymidylate kinase n=1 Tax=Pantoea piersonii TaxID=2364647 RepID=UPI00289A8574|nr:thymidylate kinase [Pantoea piersonii]
MNSEYSSPLIAVIGSDGSGKSTVCDYLLVYLQNYGPAVRVHLGKQAGNVGRAAAQLPLIGNMIGKKIEQNTKKVRSKKGRMNMLPSLVISFFVIRRLLRFRRMLAFRKQGLIVLTDRFPQAQIPGGYDGPAFPENKESNVLIKWLARREKQAFQWMADHKPDLVIKLNVDLEVACARKPDHSSEALARKTLTTSLLNFEGARIVDIDANCPLDEVLPAAERAVAAFMKDQGYVYLDSMSSVKTQ